MNTHKKKRTVGKVFCYLLLLCMTIITAFPFLWMILSSFKQSSEFYLLVPKLLPEKFQWNNFTELFEKWSFARYYKNSIFVTAVQVISNILIVLLAGYGFAKFNFKGKNSLFLIVMSSTMIPWVATIIPLYILTNSLHLIDTYPGLIIPGMADAFSIFLARNFMSTIPTPLLEAARIDGAGELKVFFRVVIAQVKPLIAVIAIQKMISSWNAFQWPLLVVNSEELRTLPIAMAKLSSLYYDSYNLKMAAATLAIIPVLILYIAFQKYFVEGISLSGIK